MTRLTLPTHRMPPAAPPESASAETLADAVRTALARSGVRAGDVLLVHADLAALGAARPDDPALHAALLEALRELLGPTGTLLVPTYTFSFCRGEPFDPAATPTAGGPWSPTASFLEFVRHQPGAVRSHDPIHSVAGLGPEAAALLGEVPPTCFGRGSVFERLVQRDAAVALLGLPLEEATIRHHAEEMADVPFRFRKLFTGRLRTAEGERPTGWSYSVRILAEQGAPDGRRLERRAREAGLAAPVPCGAGALRVVRAAAFDRLVRQLLADDPWATARGPAGDALAYERDRVDGGVCTPALPPHATMRQMIDALWRLPRDLLSDGYDAALAALATQLPMTVHRVPSGTECWSWIVPEQWSCHEAVLETLDGRTLLSYAEHPLHVMSYSLPFDGEVTHDELLAHLHVHPRLPDAIPFVFRYYERDWGLCCTRLQRDALSEARYRVRIRTSTRRGAARIGEVVAPGRTDDTIVLCAHLCHPAQVNDDLSGVVVGVEVMRALLARAARGELRHSYRFLIVPETIGSLAWLSRHESLIPQLRGGLFLEMLGLPYPLALQRSFAGDTPLDTAFTLALREADPDGWTGDFRTVIGNDERQFNAPGVRVPMLSLSRVLPASHPDAPYPEYHSSRDDAALASDAQLAASRDAVLHLLDVLERDVVPQNHFRGEVFCSRYGIHVDPYTDPDGHRALFDVMYLIDGTRSIAQIARACGTSFDAVWRIVRQLARHGLVSA